MISKLKIKSPEFPKFAKIFIYFSCNVNYTKKTKKNVFEHLLFPFRHSVRTYCFFVQTSSITNLIPYF